MKICKRLRRAVREAEPEIYHDVTRWRFRSIEQAMLDAGLSAEEASAGAHAAMINFAKWRSRIDVPQQTHDTLKQLAKKWPLVAITNGNAQPELFGLGIILSLCCALARTGAQNRSAICTSAAEKLNVPIGEILHVGDDLTTDVGGAIRSGMQACWIRPENGDLMQTGTAVYCRIWKFPGWHL